jgi:hypothetical protein
VRYPLGDDTKIEAAGARTATGAIIVDKSRCRLETWNTRRRDGRWHASQAVWNLGSTRCGRRLDVGGRWGADPSRTPALA